ncbi:MAG TPA: barstar family protein [Candidatus Avacidaminococcus intestinavium]|uniref:Barstar family protein n=1 Tax=Candidatus Avacidaminococcus intestinavium TaxID=2840684 RepID=A0A9D1MR77_9FIRM|nr:barstar family protein [Candidatus Avacidaminococcus intestinavium]
MNELLLDGRNLKTKEQVHAYLARQTFFPATYGYNLDALFDVLTSVTGCVIKVRYRQSLLDNLGSYGVSLLNVIAEAAKENKHLQVVVQDNEGGEECL